MMHACEIMVLSPAHLQSGRGDFVPTGAFSAVLTDVHTRYVIMVLSTSQIPVFRL